MPLLLPRLLYRVPPMSFSPVSQLESRPLVLADLLGGHSVQSCPASSSPSVPLELAPRYPLGRLRLSQPLPAPTFYRGLFRPILPVQV